MASDNATSSSGGGPLPDPGCPHHAFGRGRLAGHGFTFRSRPCAMRRSKSSRPVWQGRHIANGSRGRPSAISRSLSVPGYRPRRQPMLLHALRHRPLLMRIGGPAMPSCALKQGGAFRARRRPGRRAVWRYWTSEAPWRRLPRVPASRWRELVARASHALMPRSSGRRAWPAGRLAAPRKWVRRTARSSRMSPLRSG